ncbi:hypothetical protein [Acetobacter senegalensis]|uniref:hypothetical protein n=1 Tax=Acetobacter senegalensis TaxID=446692 RepID=UPI001EDC60F8|nr:hypothetical protein [Acetobacter senegalensis]MCG4256928.1 hypothetical protein [Acetobacter senegalensis]MCG4266934.1 hypothetical protein [Acetobacter senegalensis]
MAVYMISYDIKVKDSFEYQPLYEAIKGISGTWCHPVESVWFVDTVRFSATDIMNKLKPFLTLKDKGGDDIVIRRCIDSGAGHYKSDAVDWMNDPSRTWAIPRY